MKLYINPTGGFAGDMFSAALISAGAGKDQMLNALKLAASKIGKADISITSTHDNATRLLMKLKHNDNHLPGHDARHLLLEIFEELEITEKYRGFGMVALQNLIDAEIKAHSENTFLTDHHHHTHKHGHHHHHSNKSEAFLHEAQDILIDITGAAMGLQLLDTGIRAVLTAPVSYGGGMITFSHGTLPVPAPATKNIIEKFNIPVKSGPVDFELFTPTGAAILSALFPILKENEKPEDENISTGSSRGTKDLAIPPLKICITK
ncbi:MAG: LarC family nickel insertion protein [Chlorobi bacterium]|nr:LarC family nickel insertion protein [Chlorobiota bacterium]